MKISSILFLIGASVCITKGDDSSLDQLCENGITLDCVKNYFKENGKCSVVHEAKDTITVKENLAIFLPHIDLTVVTTETDLSRLDGKIKTFAKDPNTGNLIISVDFSEEGIYCSAPGTYFASYADSGEPKVVQEYVNATYKVEITTIIPGADEITSNSLKQSQSFAYFPTTDAIYIGPKFTENPDFKDAYDGLLNDIPTALKEIFNTKASYLFSAYLQNYICDFKQENAGSEYDLDVLKSVIDVDTEDESQHNKPCAGSDDVKACVQNYFEEHSSCSAITGSTDETVHRSIYNYKMPYINSSVVLMDSEISGLEGNIESFFLDEKTNNLVMTIDFNSLVVKTPENYLYIGERGDLPKMIQDTSKVQYPAKIKVVLPIEDGITEDALRKAVITTTFNKSPTFNLGPNFSDSDDPQMQALYKMIEDDPTTVGKEIMLTEGPYVLLAFIQTKICDFGIPIMSS